MSHNSFRSTFVPNQEQLSININNVYDLSDLLEKLQVQIDLSPTTLLDTADANTEYNIYSVNESEGIISAKSIYNSSLGSWTDFTYSGFPFNGAIPLFDANRVISDLNNLSDVDTVNNQYQIGFRLNRINYNTKTGSGIFKQRDQQNNWDPSTSTQTYLPEDDEVLINLGEDFFDSLNNADLEDNLPIDYEYYVSKQPTNGVVVDLGEIAAEGWDANEFADNINNLVALSISSTAPSNLELKRYNWGSVIFKHENSDERISLNVGDIDRSYWVQGFSGQGGIDPIFDVETGERIGTEVEFGLDVNNRWTLEEFIRDAQNAFEYDRQWISQISTQTGINQTPSEISQGIANFDSPQKWNFESLQMSGNASWSTHISGLSDAIAATNFHFYTRPLNTFDDAAPPSVVQFEVEDFKGAYLNLADGNAGFDIFLNSPTFGVDNDYIQNDQTNGYLRYNPSSVTGVLDEDIALQQLNELNVYFRNELDGLNESIDINYYFGNENLEFLEEQIVNPDEFSVTYELQHVGINKDPIDYDTSDAGGGYSRIDFNRPADQVQFQVAEKQGDFSGYYHINQIFPDYELISSIELQGLLDIENQNSPTYFGLGLAGDPSVGFTYELTSNNSLNALTQNAVLGDSVQDDDIYQLNLYAESLQRGYDIEATDITLKFNPDLFNNVDASHIKIGGELPLANAVHVDNENGLIRISAASLSELGLGNGLANASGNQALATIDLNFDEASISTLDKNGDGSLKISPLAFDVSVNEQETIFSRSFTDSDGLQNKEILTLDDLGGSFSVDGQEVTLYEARINLEQQSDGLVLGTQRVIGTEREFTNLVRTGDTIETSVEWLNVGNIRADELSWSSVSNQNADLSNAYFTNYSVASGEFIDGEFITDSRESTVLHTTIDITGEAGNVVDLSDGIVSISATGSDVFTNAGKGSSNLITFKGDLNYDGRVSMKDLAYLNAGAARQQLVTGYDDDGNEVQVASEASYARDVDADFSGKIDLADLSVLDADWGKTLHTGDQDFQGSADVSWSELDSQGESSTWDNDSFKDQNAIEAESDYVGSLESPTSTGVIGADGNTTANDNDITGTEFQDQVPA